MDCLIMDAGFEVDNRLDNDNEVSILLPGEGHYGEDIEKWVSKEDAVVLIEHLKKLFNI